MSAKIINSHNDILSTHRGNRGMCNVYIYMCVRHIGKSATPDPCAPCDRTLLTTPHRRITPITTNGDHP